MNSQLQQHFANYPKPAQQALLELRQLILSCAQELELGEVEESIKWGEASYSVKGGSPIRLDWKSKTPEYYYMYFHCQTRLVKIFHELHGQQLNLLGKRAIQLTLGEPLPLFELRHCFGLALRYHQLKHLPLLGQ